VLDKTTDKMRRGIVYDELTDDQKSEFEDSFATGDYFEESIDYSGTVISASDVGKRVINLGTIDAMLNDLMKNGLKINAGDKLGKTIIFADSHFEAKKIVERFQYLYPHLGLDFCKLIDSHIDNALNLIDSFGERESMPQIAVSVDMMDTGIDVPDVLNLVFFKQVFSKIKFLQMIGRGTRLCNDIYGPGENKAGFLIFDYFDNFHYFSTQNTWSALGNTGEQRGMLVTPQSVLINKRKLAILQHLTEAKTLAPFDEKYRDELRDYFISAVRCLNNDDLEVQYNMAYVSKYRTAEMWNQFNNDKICEIEAHILPLLPPEKAKAKVKSFDLLIYVMESEIPTRIESGKDIRKVRNGFVNVGAALTERMEALQKLKTIPAIVQKEALINSMIDGEYLFENFSLENCEKVRVELRDLMQYIPDKKEYYVINADDYVIESGDGEAVVKEKTYAEKAREYLQNNTPALAKLQNLDELTSEEKQELIDVFTVKLGTPADYAAWSNNVPLLPFLRVQVGISDNAVQTKFGSFYNESTLDGTQMEYLSQIINYAKENGDITFMDLQRISPFCDVDIMELFGPKIAHIKELINGLHKPII
jgi:type I restriction enzyme R subunit